MWVVVVGYKKGQKDPAGENARGDMLDTGFSGVRDVRTLQTYVIGGEVPEDMIRKAGEELLADRIVQYFSFDRFGEGGEHLENVVKERDVWVAEVFFRPGVMDVVGLSVEKAMEVLGAREASVRTGTTYVIRGELGDKEMESVCRKCLANELIQTYTYRRL